MTISSGKRTHEWALTFFPSKLPPRLLLHATRSFFFRYPLCISQIQLCSFPRPPPCGTFAYLISPGGGALANFAWSGGQATAARGFLSSKITKHWGFYWKHKPIGRLAHPSRTQKTCRGLIGGMFSRFYAFISSLLIKTELTLQKDWSRIRISIKFRGSDLSDLSYYYKLSEQIALNTDRNVHQKTRHCCCFSFLSPDGQDDHNMVTCHKVKKQWKRSFIYWLHCGADGRAFGYVTTSISRMHG